MSTTIRDVLVKITTDNSGLSQGLDAAQKTLKGFAMAAGAALGAATAAFAGVTMAAIKSSQEIDRFAKVSNASTTEFQRWTAAAGTAGVATEKMADILKDVNDRVGDFMATGGGPMADFFENVAPKVGVTAEMFRKLSGPQALQLYVDTLQKAGASQQDLTFYMEAMAGDATLLLPLLRNNGAELNRLADAAQRAGAILSEETLASLRDAKESVDQIQTSFSGFTNLLVAAVAPALAVAAATFAEMSAQGGPIAEAVDRIAYAFTGLAGIMSSPEFIGAATTALTTIINLVAGTAQGLVWLTENINIATLAVGSLAAAVAILGGPLSLAIKLGAAAAGAYLLMGQNSKVAEDGAYNVAAAEAALIGELNVFSQSASPAARNESRQRVISLKEQATAALATAEAELALAAAMQQKRLTEAPDWIKEANEAGVLNIPEYDAAISKVGELKGQIKEMTSALKDLDDSGGSGGGVAATPLPIVPDYTGAGLGLPPTGSGTGAAGGGAEGDGLTTRLDALKQELSTERELLETWYVERQTLLDEALAAREITEEEYRLQRERLEQEHADRMKAIDKTSVDTKLGIMKSVFGGLAGLMETGNKKLFAIGKAASIASAVIDGYEAAVSSYKHGAKIGGPALGAVYAGVSLARTAAMIAKISSQSYGGGASGGTGGGGTGGGNTTVAPQTTETRTANINFYGGFQPTQETIRMIAGGLNDWLGDGGKLNVGGA